jgi:ureidoglycolate lyase
VAPALDANQPDFHRVRCFLAQADQGVNYTKGTWHHPLIALKTPADFLVIDRVGVGHNCDEVWVPDHLSLRIERQSWEALLC